MSNHPICEQQKPQLLLAKSVRCSEGFSAIVSQLLVLEIPFESLGNFLDLRNRPIAVQEAKFSYQPSNSKMPPHWKSQGVAHENSGGSQEMVVHEFNEFGWIFFKKIGKTT